MINIEKKTKHTRHENTHGHNQMRCNLFIELKDESGKKKCHRRRRHRCHCIRKRQRNEEYAKWMTKDKFANLLGNWQNKIAYDLSFCLCLCRVEFGVRMAKKKWAENVAQLLKRNEYLHGENWNQSNIRFRSLIIIINHRHNIINLSLNYPGTFVFLSLSLRLPFHVLHPFAVHMRICGDTHFIFQFSRIHFGITLCSMYLLLMMWRRRRRQQRWRMPRRHLLLWKILSLMIDKNM